MRLSQQITGSASLLDATSAIANWRALTLLAGSIAASMLLVCLMAMTGSAILVFLGALLALAVLFYGGNAVGIVLMDAARGEERLSLADAVFQSLLTGHRLVLVMLTGLAAMVSLFVIVALLFLLCKIPVLGPVALVLVLPASALALGTLGFTLGYVFNPLAAASTWAGCSVRETLIFLLAVARQQLLTVLVRKVLLMLLVIVIGLFIGMVVLLGLSSVSSMAIGIIGRDLNPGLGLMSGLLGMGGGMSGHLIGAALGSALLLAAAMLIPLLIAMQGDCLIYLGLVDELDIGSAEREFESGQQQLQQKQHELRQRLDARRDGAAAESAARATPVAPRVECPHCHAALEDEDDAFCGYCGHELR